MQISVNLEHKSYDIFIKKSIISNISSHYDIQNKKILILTDENIPQSLVDTVKNQCNSAFVYRVNAGESSKSIQNFEKILTFMLEKDFTRSDLIIALGGGVIGDLSGFVASAYMRGISYISIPTTTLSMIDSSIGGKTAVNLGSVKNIVGAFHHPDLVLIDIETLKTLDKSNFNSGLVEALKAGLIYDAKLYELFKNNNFKSNLEEIIFKALLVKKDVVEKDEKEQNLRKILNFGHTIGHGFESFYNFTKPHGECVALGMSFFAKSETLKNELSVILNNLDINLNIYYDIETVFNYIKKDKKSNGDNITVITVSDVGNATLETISFSELFDILKGEIQC